MDLSGRAAGALFLLLSLLALVRVRPSVRPSCVVPMLATAQPSVPDRRFLKRCVRALRLLVTHRNAVTFHVPVGSHFG